MLNRSPTYAVKDITLEEAWSGNKPNVDHFRIFGCIGFAHIPDQRRTKLEDKAEKCVFLGVSEKSKAYRLYNPNTKKVIISRDVVLDEENFWIWEEQSVGTIPTDFDEKEHHSQPIGTTENCPKNSQIEDTDQQIDHE